MSMKPIPEGNHTLTPYLVVEDSNSQVAWLEEALGAQQVYPPHMTPDGVIAHAQLQIGSSRIMVGGVRKPEEAMAGMIYLYTEDCDGLYRQAMAAGGESVLEPTNQFYGDRTAGVKDAAGNLWWIATHVEDVAPDEMERRMQEMMKGEG